MGVHNTLGKPKLMVFGTGFSHPACDGQFRLSYTTGGVLHAGMFFNFDLIWF